jgi:hypothetical protein
MSSPRAKKTTAAIAKDFAEDVAMCDVYASAILDDRARRRRQQRVLKLVDQLLAVMAKPPCSIDEKLIEKQRAIRAEIASERIPFASARQRSRGRIPSFLDQSVVRATKEWLKVSPTTPVRDIMEALARQVVRDLGDAELRVVFGRTEPPALKLQQAEALERKFHDLWHHAGKKSPR